METKEIVPIQFTQDFRGQNQRPQKNTVAAKIKYHDKEITLLNGIDKYILFAIIKELITNDSKS